MLTELEQAEFAFSKVQRVRAPLRNQETEEKRSLTHNFLPREVTHSLTQRTLTLPASADLEDIDVKRIVPISKFRIKAQSR